MTCNRADTNCETHIERDIHIHIHIHSHTHSHIDKVTIIQLNQGASQWMFPSIYSSNCLNVSLCLVPSSCSFTLFVAFSQIMHLQCEIEQRTLKSFTLIDFDAVCLISSSHLFSSASSSTSSSSSSPFSSVCIFPRPSQFIFPPSFYFLLAVCSFTLRSFTIQLYTAQNCLHQRKQYSSVNYSSSNKQHQLFFPSPIFSPFSSSPTSSSPRTTSSNNDPATNSLTWTYISSVLLLLSSCASYILP